MPPKSNYKKKARRPALRRYTRKSSGVTASTVRKICRSVTAKKAETKTLLGSSYDLEVGQIAGDGPGYLTRDLTSNMLMSTGTGSSQRIGNAIDFTSCHLNIQITEQSNATSAAAQFQFMIVHDSCPNDNVYTTGDINNPVEDMFLKNNFIRSAGGADVNIKTYGSQKNLDYMGKRFKIMAVKNVTMRPDTIVSTDNRNKTFTMGLKLKKPMKMRYNGIAVGNYIPDSAGRFFLLVFCSAGNAGSASTLSGGVPRTAINSGYNIAYNAQNYFKDY